MPAFVIFTETEDWVPLKLASPWVLSKTQTEQKWHWGKNLGHIKPVALLIGKEHESRLGQVESESYITFKGNETVCPDMGRCPKHSKWESML